MWFYKEFYYLTADLYVRTNLFHYLFYKKGLTNNLYTVKEYEILLKQISQDRKHNH